MATFTITGGGATGYGANGPNVKVANVVIDLTDDDFSALAATDTIEAIEVPAGTTLAELEEYMVYKPIKLPTPHGEEHWTVVGSKGNHYTVRLKGGQYTCTCAGFGWRRKCRHIDGIKNG